LVQLAGQFALFRQLHTARQEGRMDETLSLGRWIRRRRKALI
jgi:hypothetical protein